MSHSLLSSASSSSSYSSSTSSDALLEFPSLLAIKQEDHDEEDRIDMEFDEHIFDYLSDGDDEITFNNSSYNNNYNNNKNNNNNNNRGQMVSKRKRTNTKTTTAAAGTVAAAAAATSTTTTPTKVSAVAMRSVSDDTNISGSVSNEGKGNTVDNLRNQQVVDELMCSVCLDIQVDSTTCVPCGHCFCSNCLVNVTSCPECRATIRQKVPCKTLNNLISNLIRASIPPLQQQQQQHQHQNQQFNQQPAKQSSPPHYATTTTFKVDDVQQYLNRTNQDNNNRRKLPSSWSANNYVKYKKSRFLDHEDYSSITPAATIPTPPSSTVMGRTSATDFNSNPFRSGGTQDQPICID